jgi:surface antigen
MRNATAAAAIGLALLLAGCAAGLDGVLDGVLDDGAPPAHADLTDRQMAVVARTVQKALETQPDGGRQTWQFGERGPGGRIRPTRTYVDAAGQFCRQYTEELRIGARTSLFRHEACRDGDGRWIWL